MMIQIGEKTSPAEGGNKAAALSILKENGYPVPAGVILHGTVWSSTLELNGAKRRILDVLCNAALAPVEKSGRLQRLVESFHLPEDVVAELTLHLDNEKAYAVRSSGLQEDLPGLSFAGQYNTFLHVQGLDAVCRAVVRCYASMFSETVLTYLSNHAVSAETLEMAIIVQEMVDAEKSGVVFTLNPVTGNDCEMAIEAAAGLGDALVGGYADPERYAYNWLEKRYTERPQSGLLSGQELDCLTEAAQNIQMLFGWPCDIEFAFRNGGLFILQARAITRVGHQGLQDIWSTADFKDGGVSASVCLPFMWSLYEYIWEISLKQFLVGTHILPEKSLRKLGRMFYARPYWNLSVVKEAMSRVPGYKEREFDSEYGVAVTYEGDGETTRITPKSLLSILRIALSQKKLLEERVGSARTRKETLLQKYESYRAGLGAGRTLEEWESICKTLTMTDYLESESTYFTQIFINTVQQALYKDTIKKYVDDGGYFDLIGGLDNISHLLPFYDMWDITRRIRTDEESLRYWRNATAAGIREAYENGSDRFGIPEFAGYIGRYGYHSEKELDISYPCYEEDVEKVAEMFRDTLLLEDAYSPGLDRERQRRAYLARMDCLKATTGRKFARLRARTEKMRELLWWREEFRDISTRYYYLIRRYILALAEAYRQAGILADTGDIWFLKVEDLWRFIDRKLGREELDRIIRSNKQYYLSYRNYMSDNEIGAVFQQAVLPAVSSNTLKGLGCNSGIVTGTARVVGGLEEIRRLRKDDILVTRFTDTGWTSKFALLRGIVTEYGGVLCHAAIVSREYGIPCIVGVKDAVRRIPDGAAVTINGATGEVVVIDV